MRHLKTFETLTFNKIPSTIINCINDRLIGISDLLDVKVDIMTDKHFDIVIKGGKMGFRFKFEFDEISDIQSLLSELSNLGCQYMISCEDEDYEFPMGKSSGLSRLENKNLIKIKLDFVIS